MRTRAAVVAGVVVAVALAAGVALWATRGGDATGWSAPQAAGPGADADAAVAGDGTAVAAWAEEHRGATAVVTAERRPGGDWGAPRTILPAQRWTVRNVSVAAGAGGDVTVAFRLIGRRGGRGLVMGAHRPAGGGWEAPQALTRVGAGYGDLATAVAPDGGVAVATAAVGTRTHLDATVRDPGGLWTDPQEVARGLIVARPGVAVAPGGRAYVATVEGFGRSTHLALYVHAGGDWRAAPAPTGADDGVGAVALAVGGDGVPVVAWTRRGPGGATTLAASALRGGAWNPAQVLDRGPLATTFGDLAVAPAPGGAAVAWARWGREWTRVAVRAALVRDGRAAPPADVDVFDIPDIRAGAQVSTPGPPPTRISVSQAGSPVLLWDRLVGRAPAVAGRLQVSRASASGMWTPPEAVDAAPIDGWPLAVGAARDRVVATWAEYVSPATGGIRVIASERIG
ncbi:MAG: hypothetical protein AB7O78_06900 [Thermoleophilia bacterium]